MVSSDDIRWLNAEFGAAMSNAISGTSLTVEFLAALACQESGEVWPSLRRQALAADDSLPVAHRALGHLKFFRERRSIPAHPPVHRTQLFPLVSLVFPAQFGPGLPGMK